MPRDRYSRPASPVSSRGNSRSPSPPYNRSRSRPRYTPQTSQYTQSRSPSPSPLRPPSRRHRGRSSSASSRSSPSSSPSRGSKGGKRSTGKSESNDKIAGFDKTALKTSLVFLGAVGAATFAAHKYWPKGITYGEKEEWEEEKEIIKKKMKKELAGEPAHGSHGPPPRQNDGERYPPPPDERRYLQDRREPRGRRPEFEDDQYRVPIDRLIRVGPPDPRAGRLELAEARVGRGDRVEVEQVTMARLPSIRQRPRPDEFTTASVASGSRSGDARRDRFVQDENRRSYYEAEEKVYRDDRGPSRYTEREREEFREVDRMQPPPPPRARDDRAAIPRYVERDEPPSRARDERPSSRYTEREDSADMDRVPRGRSDFDQPSFYDRSDRRSYVRQDDGSR